MGRQQGAKDSFKRASEGHDQRNLSSVRAGPGQDGADRVWGEERLPSASVLHTAIPPLLAPGWLMHDLWGAKGEREQRWP